MNKIELGKIAEVSLGYSFRESLTKHASEQKNFFVLQAKDIAEATTFVEKEFLQAIKAPSDISYNLPLKNNDIALVYRTSPGREFRASTLQFHETSQVIATSSLIIIRITDDHVLPEFLTLYLNSQSGQKELMQIATGSSIVSIPISKLRSLSVPIPPKEKQEILVRLLKNIQQQNNLLQQSMVLRQRIKQDIITQTIS